MSGSGYVFLHRKLIDSRVFQSPELLKVFIWCLLKANHKEVWVPVTTGRGETEVFLKPGQFIFGRNAAAKKLKMKPRTIYDRIKKLELLFMIGVNPATHYSVITVTNWDTYQAQKNKTQQPTNNQPTTNQQPTNTDNNDKNDKNIKHSENGHVPCAKIHGLFNSILSDLPRVQIMTDTRKANLKARWNTSEKTRSIEWWENFFEYINESDFLMGRTGQKNKRPFKASFDWIINKTNFVKIIEGNYTNR